MPKSVFITHGRTESGDDVEMVAWSQEPSSEAIMDHYREAMSDEIEAFGEDIVADYFKVTEVTEWGS